MARYTNRQEKEGLYIFFWLGFACAFIGICFAIAVYSVVLNQQVVDQRTQTEKSINVFQHSWNKLLVNYVQVTYDRIQQENYEGWNLRHNYLERCKDE